MVLAIESSCDDTSVASRNHSLMLTPLVEKVMQGFDPVKLLGVCSTNRPGLMGSLLVGVSVAKSLALAWQIPWLGVNHLEGHLLAPFLIDDHYSPSFILDQPVVALTVSGGHTSLVFIKNFGDYQVMGQTRDDAAGEAFDKFGKMLGLGFPGGVRVDQLAQTGDPKKFVFPQSLFTDDSLEMSFSGLKSSAHRLLQSLGPAAVKNSLNDLCAGFQHAVTEALVIKLERAAVAAKVTHIVLTGGVSANSSLRLKAQAMAARRGWEILIPPLRFCTDNAAMIGLVGARRLRSGEKSSMQVSCSPALLETDFGVWS
jgi:N6-L-threonylcarbamoyladenine synthase